MRHLLPIALLALAACGSSDPKTLTSEGAAALGKGDYRGAIAKFDEALAGLAPASPEYFQPALRRCEALAGVDGAAAKKDFLDLAGKLPDKVREDDYGLICSALLRGEFPVPAIELMHAGNERFPNSAKMKATTEAVVAAANRAATPEALRALDSLGYAGGGK